MDADAVLLALVFALCAAGALAGLVVPERRVPQVLACFGSLAALAARRCTGSCATACASAAPA